MFHFHNCELFISIFKLNLDFNLIQFLNLNYYQLMSCEFIKSVLFYILLIMNYFCCFFVIHLFKLFLIYPSQLLFSHFKDEVLHEYTHL